MNLRLIFLLISILAVVIPLILIVLAMQKLQWDFSIAASDLGHFLQSIFGQVVVVGYFLSGLSLTLLIIYEANARSDYFLYWALLPLVIFGIGVALPFYLYLRMPRRE